MGGLVLWVRPAGVGQEADLHVSVGTFPAAQTLPPAQHNCQVM